MGEKGVPRFRNSGKEQDYFVGVGLEKRSGAPSGDPDAYSEVFYVNGDPARTDSMTPEQTRRLHEEIEKTKPGTTRQRGRG